MVELAIRRFSVVDGALSPSSTNATRRQSTLLQVSRAVTVLDQDRSDRSWSWDQGPVLELQGDWSLNGP